jgi:putative membrane protein
MASPIARSIATPIVRPPTRVQAWVLVVVVVLALAISAIGARDRMTWFMEVVWVILGLPFIAWRWRAFPLTLVLSVLLALHALVLIHGGMYTYAETPLGFAMRDMFRALGFDVVRNPWDRLGHFMQGFVPVLLARELLRCTPLRPGPWLTYLCIAAALSFSAFFELLEWWAALAYGADADAFLATQGDVWDTQWDMFLCLCGACVSLLLWSRLHDRQLGVVRSYGKPRA